MAYGTGQDGSVAMRHRGRHRRVLIRKPVDRIGKIIDLRLRVTKLAAWHRLRPAIIYHPRLNCARYRIGPIGTFGAECDD
jgi:hypothetical protein